MAMLELLIWVSQGFGHPKIHKTLRAHLATWVKKSMRFNIDLAPEVMCRQNHCCAVDYFALGVIGYEFMLGRVRIVTIKV